MHAALLLLPSLPSLLPLLASSLLLLLLHTMQE